jgi:hypothetical protein
MPSDRIRLSVAEALDRAEHALRGIGDNAGDAWIRADHAIVPPVGTRALGTYPAALHLPSSRGPIVLDIVPRHLWAPI